MISVQLLASCFTPPQNINTPTLPSSWYHRKDQTDEDWLSTRLLSSLRQHTQWKHSPAFGHQARNNSAVSLWPERDGVLSRETLLAEQISLNRRLRQQEDGAAKESTERKRGCQSELSGEEPKSRPSFPSRRRRHLGKPEETASSHQVLQNILGLRPQALSPRNRIERKSILKVMRGLRVRM